MFAVRLFYGALYWLVPIWYTASLTMTRFRRWPALPLYEAPEQIADALRWGRNWRPDPLKGVLDVIMDPRRLQARINAGEKEFGDCDDHALYWATTLLQSGLADRAWLGTVWYAGDGERGDGHVVCVFSERGQLYWTDYGMPSPVVAPWGWAHQSASMRGKRAICAGRFEVRLRRNGAPRLRWGVRRVLFDK